MTGKWNRTITTPAGYANQPKGRQQLLTKLYLGKVKDNRDARGMGRLRVWIPELSHRENDPDGWLLVSYASPFAGASNIERNGNTNTFEDTQKSYGFWAVPPDLNVQVLCMFANGDSARGFWLACVYDEQMDFMIPGLASDDNKSPKAEYNRKVPSEARKQNPNRPAHTPLDTGLKSQGLNTDTLRGINSSSARRKGDHGSETNVNVRSNHENQPAKVYGFLSPGGHQVVLDDGFDRNNNKENSYIRFRTRNGTQLLIDDTEGFIYMISKDGKTWMELNDRGRGSLDIYSLGNVNIHAENGSINLKAGKDINMQAGKDVNIQSGDDMKINSKSKLDILANDRTRITSKDSMDIKASDDMKIQGDNFSMKADNNFFKESGRDMHVLAGTGGEGGFIRRTAIFYEPRPSTGQITGNDAVASSASTPNSASKPPGKTTVGPANFSNGTWKSGSDYKGNQNIIPIVPQHEPWPIHTFNKPVRTLATSTEVDEPPEVSNETGRIESSFTGEGPSTDNPTILEDFEANTPLGGTVCGLDEEQTKAYLDQLGQRESSNNYQSVNPLGFTGKYQFGAPALEDIGYIKKGASATGSTDQVLSNSNNWTGKDGINSREDFLNNPDVQERAILRYTNQNCSTLKRIGVIDANSTDEEIAGYLAASHLGGPGAAKNLKNGTIATDAFGTSTREYFNLGVGSIVSIT